MEKFVEHVQKPEHVKAQPQTASFKIVAKVVQKRSLKRCQLKFVYSIAMQLQPFLKKFQSDAPLVPFLAEDLAKLLHSVMVLFINRSCLPSSQAWDSGAWNWNADQRKYFANDLDQQFFLIAVTASSNRSKSDRDPAEWMPPNANYHCEYVRIWIEIKRAWDLSVDQAEHDYLARKLASC